MERKSFVCLIVGVFLASACLWIGSSQVEAATSGNYEYSESGGTATITGYIGTGGTVSIPDTIDGYPVVIIGEDAFSYNDDITSVTIPDSVITIEKDAFQNCDRLIRVTVGNGVTIIGDSAFKYCDALVRLYLGNSIETIGPSAFYDTALISLTIPDSVTSIGDNAFRTCDVLERVGLGNSVTSIGEDAFRSCYALTSISIPASVTSIGSHAFDYCKSLSVVYFMGDAPTIGSYVFDGTADDFNICYTTGATGFAGADWEGFLTADCACSDDTDCAEGEECAGGVCVVDDAPIIESGPFLSAGPWPVLPTDSDNPMVLTSGYGVLWTFSDDYASCPGLCTHTAEYQVIGDSSWTALNVNTDTIGELYAYVWLAVNDLQNATTYALRFTLTDCAGQRTDSQTYYFRVATEDNPPVLEAGPFLAAGPWPIFKRSAETAFTLSENYDVVWTFSDDYASCEDGPCTHRFKYRKVGTETWTRPTPIEGQVGELSYAYLELPITSLENGTYEFNYTVLDCLGQKDLSNVHYFKVDKEDSVTCNGREFTDPEVCSGNGVCVSQDTCACNHGWAGEWCEEVEPEQEPEDEPEPEPEEEPEE